MSEVIKLTNDFLDEIDDLAFEAAKDLTFLGKRICLAESFTGGAVTASLVKVPGISASLVESMVTYSHESKINRLNVAESVLNVYGAVSAETAHEMVRGLLEMGNCDVALATTGNAGPTVENGEVGLFYIGIGDEYGIKVYKNIVKYDDKASDFEIRNKIIQRGVYVALYELCKHLKNI